MTLLHPFGLNRQCCDEEVRRIVGLGADVAQPGGEVREECEIIEDFKELSCRSLERTQLWGNSVGEREKVRKGLEEIKK